MANAIYPSWKAALMQLTANNSLAGSGATGVYCALIDSGVRGYNSADDMENDMHAAIGGTPMEIGATKSYTGGVFDGADVTFTAVAGVVSYEALLLYIANAGATSTWPLVVYLDTSITNLPVTSNGGNIIVTWDAAGIFGL